MNALKTARFSREHALEILPLSCRARAARSADADTVATEIVEYILEDRGHTPEDATGEALLLFYQYSGIPQDAHDRFCPVCT